MQTPLIFDEYRRITVNHLIESFGIEKEHAEVRYDRALKLWEDTAFEYLRNPMTKKVGIEFLDFLESCDKLFPKYLYENLEINHNDSKLRTRPFEYSISSKIEALYPETEKVLKTLVKHGYEMHVASSSHSSHIKGLMKANSLDRYMKSFFGFDTLAATKHTVKYYKGMVDKVKANPLSCVMVGNSMHEILKPRKLKMKTVHINRERKVPFDVRKLADFSLENLSSLPEHLDSLLLDVI